MNLTKLNLKDTATAIPLLKQLATLINWSFVCIEKHKGKDCVVFSKGNYRTGFYEMKLFKCDLELSNIELMIQYNSTR